MRAVVAQGSTAIVDGRKVVHLCSNDYLGLSRNPFVVRIAARSLKEVSQCSSRLIAGNHPTISELERELAAHRKAEAALVFPTGYMANIGAVTALADRSTTILSDELNHASIIDACRLSGAKIMVFRHNDVEHLAELMRDLTGRILIITEGIFSMDGDVSRIAEICKLAKRYSAITLVDDAHGDFIFGRDFSGVPSMQKTNVDVHISSLSKGLGCFGGYVAASSPIVDLMINVSRQFIYTSALPPHLCTAALQAMKLAKRGNLQTRLHENVEFVKKKLREAGLAIGNSASQIIPILIGSEEKTLGISRSLLDAGFYCQAIRYPTVSKGDARLRISITAAHKTDELRKAVDALIRIVQ